MFSSTIWMAVTAGLLSAVALVTFEEALRRRAACIRFQHELRRGAFHPVHPRRPPVAPRHIRAVASSPAHARRAA